MGERAGHGDGPLAGKVIALPEGRELDLCAAMVSRTGAGVWRCPLVAIQDTPKTEPVEAWLGKLVRGELNDVVFLTGEGVRRLMGFAHRGGQKQAAVSALRQVRKVTRGPKPVKALREVGLRTDAPAAEPTSEGVMQTLGRFDLRGRAVGVQLYGEDPNERLMRFVEGCGARPWPVWPYVYASAEEDEQVVELMEAMAAGRVDAVMFTSRAQVARLRKVAAAHEREGLLRQGLGRTVVAAVGPIVGAAVEEIGAEVDVMPSGRYVLRPTVEALVDRLG